MAILLEKANKVKVAGNAVTKEQIDLGLAWATGSVTLKQVRTALKLKADTQTYIRLAIILRSAVEQRKLRLVE